MDGGMDDFMLFGWHENVFILQETDRVEQPLVEQIFTARQFTPFGLGERGSFFFLLPQCARLFMVVFVGRQARVPWSACS